MSRMHLRLLQSRKVLHSRPFAAALCVEVLSATVKDLFSTRTVTNIMSEPESVFQTKHELLCLYVWRPILGFCLVALSLAPDSV